MKQPRDGRLALCLSALLFSIYLLTFSGIYHSSDEMSMLAVTDSLARRGAWDIELLRWMGEQQGSFGPDGHLYSRKGIGTTLAALPLYWLAAQVQGLGNVQTAMLTMSLATALAGAVVYLLLRRLRYGEGASLATALAFGLGTMAWPYARYLFSESLAALALILSFYLLVCYGQTGNATDQTKSSASRAVGSKSSWFLPLLAGAGLGLAILARLNNAIVAPFLGLLLLFYLHRDYGWNWKRWVRPVVLFALPLLASLAVVAWYNWLRFGSPLTTGYLPEERFSTPFFEGFYGLTFSPGKGLFWYNPILFAALIAWPALYRRHRAEALLVATAVLANIAFYAPWFLWWAGHSWGPRFLVTILPFASLPLAPAFEAAAKRRGLAIGLGALLVLSIAVQLPGVLVDFNRYLEDVYGRLGLYHPATLFVPAHSALLGQISYVRADNLDLAWARDASVNWLALLIALMLVLLSSFALWACRRKHSLCLISMGLPPILALGAFASLLLYAPAGDVAAASHGLTSIERANEIATLTEPLLTEPFQDAYDGHLWVWGIPWNEERGTVPLAENSPIWVIGAGISEPAAARFQVGDVRLDYLAPPGQPFSDERLPVPLLDQRAYLGDSIELVAVAFDATKLRRGEVLPVELHWRAQAPIGTSYTVFLQVIDVDGTKAGQFDRLPCHGGCPTDSWRPGDLVGERYELPIDPGATPGSYQIIAGMYALETGEQLTWQDGQGTDLGPNLVLGSLQIDQ
jgi:hypothetical protein